MAQNELSTQKQIEIAEALSAIIESGGAVPPPPGSFAPPPAAKKEAETLTNDLIGQKKEQRDKLLRFIFWMTAVSFLLLATMVLLQMVVRVYMPSYTGVSDFVVNVVAVSVFGEIVAIVASIAIAVWKDPELRKD